jgi:hypothetical protein
MTMGRQLSPQELDELLGAYALDAVDGDERAQLEQWVERSPAAASELGALRETAALLAHAGGDAPAGVWARIEESLSAEPPTFAPPGRVVPFGSTRRRRAALRIGAGIAAASAVAASVTAVVVGGQVADQEERLSEIAQSMERDDMHDAAVAAAAHPDARMIHLASDDGMSATVITMPDGAGYFMGGELPRLGAGRTYQLWALTGDPEHPDMVSAGVLGRSVDVAAFRGPASAMGFSVTEERESGVAEPSGAAVVSGRFT